MRPSDDLRWTPRDAVTTGRAFTREQARAAGASRGQVRRRVERGIWVPVVGAALRHRDRPVDARMLVGAARLTWADAVVVGAAAAAFHGAPIALPTVVDVAGLVPTTRTFRGLRPRFVEIDPAETMESPGWNVVVEHRAYLQALAELPRRQAENLWAWATTRRILTLDLLREDIEAHPRRRGNRQLRELHAWGATGAVSEAERRAHLLLQEAGITGWDAGVSVRDAEGLIGVVDICFKDVRLVIEIDGVEFHRRSIIQDNRRRNRLVAVGCTVLSYTWDDIVNQPDRFVAQVRSELMRLRAGRR